MDRPMVWSVGSSDVEDSEVFAIGERASSAFGATFSATFSAIDRDGSCLGPDAAGVLETRLLAMARNVLPHAICAGGLASEGEIEVVARWIDQLRKCRPVALVVDLTGMSATAAVLAQLVPRATVVLGAQEAVARLLNAKPDADLTILPELAEQLMVAGAQSACIAVAEDNADGPLYADLMLDWLACPQAQGWLGSPWRAGDPLPAEVRGAGLVKSVGVACALARGYVHADAIVLGRMVALQVTRSAQANAIVSSLPDAGFARDASLLPMLSPGRLPRFAPRTVLQREAFSAHAGSDATGNHFDLYALVDSVERLQQVLDAGVRTVQLRIKAPPQLGLHARAPWQAFLYRSVQRSVDACRNFGAELFINDHWMVAQSLGATGVHLGQEDLLALDDVQHAQLMTSGLAIGISTHSLWELCRARSMAPHYVACGPVWPTATKTMPWRAQGLDHLAWWCAMAQTRVVAIGGILDAQRVGKAAQTGVDGVCVLSALGEDPHASVQGLQTALRSGRVSSPPIAPAAFPPASLESVYGRATHVGVNCDCGAWHAACA